MRPAPGEDLAGGYCLGSLVLMMGEGEVEAAEMEQANLAYQQTSERLDTAVRAANPGMDHPPAMSFDHIVQSIYMTTILQLGGTTQEGQQPKIDLMGARQSIDMLAILAEKTKGNLTPAEAQAGFRWVPATQPAATQPAATQPAATA